MHPVRAADHEQTIAEIPPSQPALPVSPPARVQPAPSSPASTVLKLTLAAFLGALALLALTVALTLALLALQLSHAESSLAGGLGQTA